MRLLILALAGVALAATGCGTKGPLTLPSPAQPQTRPAPPAQPVDDSKALDRSPTQ